MAIVSLVNVHKRFGATTALNGVDLLIEQPCIFGIVGPDGAGKTTLLRILVGLLEFTATTATVLDYDIATQTRQLKAQLGYVPQTFSLYPDLTVQQNLEFFADVYELPRQTFHRRRAELLALAQLEPFMNFAAGTLSGGMKQKLALICALLHAPRLLVLDEPNNGVDVLARAEMWAILRQLDTVTIIMSTGYLDEAERCNELVYLYKGQIRGRGTPDTLKARFPYQVYRVLGELPEEAASRLSRLPGVRRVRRIADTITLESTLSRSVLLQRVHELTGDGVSIETIPPTLEMVFAFLTEQAEQTEQR